MKYRHILFLSSLVVCIFIAWLSGYNFDYRSIGVATYALSSVALSLVVATMPTEKLDEKIFKKKDIK